MFLRCTSGDARSGSTATACSSRCGLRGRDRARVIARRGGRGWTAAGARPRLLDAGRGAAGLARRLRSRSTRATSRASASGGGDDLRGARAPCACRDCTRVLHVWEGGLVFYGGFSGGGRGRGRAASSRSASGWSFWALGDLFAPALAIGHAFGRLGCFAAGCCFGKACGAAARWGARFPRRQRRVRRARVAGRDPRPAHRPRPRSFPTQLYEAFGELLIFGAADVRAERLRHRDVRAP